MSSWTLRGVQKCFVSMMFMTCNCLRCRLGTGNSKMRIWNGLWTEVTVAQLRLSKCKCGGHSDKALRNSAKRCRPDRAFVVPSLPAGILFAHFCMFRRTKHVLCINGQLSFASYPATWFEPGQADLSKCLKELEASIQDRLPKWTKCLKSLKSELSQNCNWTLKFRPGAWDSFSQDIGKEKKEELHARQKAELRRALRNLRSCETFWAAYLG